MPDIKDLAEMTARTAACTSKLETKAIELLELVRELVEATQEVLETTRALREEHKSKN
jgi:hypothetical protein